MAGSVSKGGRDADLVAALAKGLTIAAAAKEVGISERTAYRKLESSEFRALVFRAKWENASQAFGVLASITPAAAIALGHLLKSGNEGIRLGAARTVLAEITRFGATMDLDERMRALEERMSERGGDNGRSGGGH